MSALLSFSGSGGDGAIEMRAANGGEAVGIHS